jgi:serine/threonine protein kinase
MNEARRCPVCQAALPADSPQGLCPACLLKRALESQTAGFTESAGVSPARWMPPTVEELAPRFPALEIIELLGRGGMGAVYKVRQKSLDRVAALKILPPHFAEAPAFSERFAREAKALARLNHPNIVTLYEFGTAAVAADAASDSPLFYFLMEFVDGATLRQLITASRLSPREALAIVPQVCDALQYAHDLGIIHRDIKPENILLDRRGRVKVADFGLAKLIEPASSPSLALNPDPDLSPSPPDLTDAARFLGTPAYIAPEQTAAPESVDHRVDIYALGVVFYQMLTGELPPTPLTPPSKKVLIDVRLDEVVLRALEREPGRRYQQVSDVKTEVETILRTATPAATPPAQHAVPASAGAPAAVPAPPRSKSLPVAVIASMILHTIALACLLIFLVATVRQTESVFRDFKVALPLATQIVLLVSQFLRNWTLLAVPLILMLLVADGAICWLLQRFKPKLHLAWSLLVLVGMAGSLLLGLWSLMQPVVAISGAMSDSPTRELVTAQMERESQTSGNVNTLVCLGIFALFVALAVAGFLLTRNRRSSAGNAPNPATASPTDWFAWIVSRLFYTAGALIALLPVFVVGIDPGDPRDRHLYRFVACPITGVAVAIVGKLLGLTIEFLQMRVTGRRPSPPRARPRVSRIAVATLALVFGSYLVGLAANLAFTQRGGSPPVQVGAPAMPPSTGSPSTAAAVESTLVGQWEWQSIEGPTDVGTSPTGKVLSPGVSFLFSADHTFSKIANGEETIGAWQINGEFIRLIDNRKLNDPATMMQYTLHDDGQTMTWKWRVYTIALKKVAVGIARPPATSASAPAAEKASPIVHIHGSLADATAVEVDAWIAKTLVLEIIHSEAALRITTLAKDGEIDVYVVGNPGIDPGMLAAAMAKSVEAAVPALRADTRMDPVDVLRRGEKVPSPKIMPVCRLQLAIDREKLADYGVPVNVFADLVARSRTLPATTQAARELLATQVVFQGRTLRLQDCARATVEEALNIIRRDYGAETTEPATTPAR